MKKKMRNIWNAIQWPLILVIFEFCILFLSLGYFEYHEIQTQLDTHPEWSMAEASKVVNQILETKEGTNAIAQFLLDHLWILVLLNACLLLPIVYHFYKKHQHRFPRHVSDRSKIHILFCSVALALCFNLILTGISSLFGISIETESQLRRPIFWMICSSGIIGPIIEEFVFRGIVYDRLQASCPKYRASFFTTLLFALYHGNLVQIVYAFAMGSYFIYCYDHYENITASIIAHISANISTLILLPYLLNLPFIWIVLSCVMLAFVGYYMFQKIRKGISIYS